MNNIFQLVQDPAVLEKSGSKPTQAKARIPVGDSHSFDPIGSKSDVFAIVGITERVCCWSALRLVSQLRSGPQPPMLVPGAVALSDK
jgi:hypothetical protein